MTTEVTRKETTEQPVLFIRRRVALHEIATALGECLPRVFGHCQAQGLAMAGPPFVRYTDMSAGMVTMEAGMPLAEAAAGEGDIEAGALPGGVAAMAVHAGPYEGMPKTHAAIERWIEGQRRQGWRRAMGVVHHRSWRDAGSGRLAHRGLLAAGLSED
jgi:AraC family transcriptional regulator